MCVDGRKRTKIKTMAENVAGECVCSMRIGFNLRDNVQFVVERFSVVTVENAAKRYSVYRASDFG